MNVSFHSPIFDLDGYVTLKADGRSNFPAHGRRVSAAATLDGNNDLSDMGFTLADNIITVSVSAISLAQIETLKHLIETYATVNYTDLTGSYQGVISLLEWVKKPVKITFLIGKSI